MGVYSLLFTKKICNLQNQDAAVHTCSENRHALSLKRNDGSSAFSRWKKLKVNGKQICLGQSISGFDLLYKQETQASAF